MALPFLTSSTHASAHGGRNGGGQAHVAAASSGTQAQRWRLGTRGGRRPGGRGGGVRAHAAAGVLAHRAAVSRHPVELLPCSLFFLAGFFGSLCSASPCLHVPPPWAPPPATSPPRAVTGP
ncbi:hypothetical protein U9M48_042422 [Paspalum notatum var. saurae]|uniref:Uncharacterized protein n=1 Tax=Paspalum notatum var. saurae TaxID=547442 RepID=A0AAQ3UQT2_PASNO